MNLFCVNLYVSGNWTQGLSQVMQELDSMLHPQPAFCFVIWNKV